MNSPAFSFDPDIVAAVLHHMNDDHVEDNLLIARAFGDREAQGARMTGVDGLAGHWAYFVPNDADTVEVALHMPWSQPISERSEIRREIVTLYDRACAELGLEPRAHD